MKNVREKFAYLYHFMSGYWMENGDLLFGNLTGAINEFIRMESHEHCVGLLIDIDKVESLGYLTNKPKYGSEISKFWLHLGARWLSEGDANLIRLLINNKLNRIGL